VIELYLCLGGDAKRTGLIRLFELSAFLIVKRRITVPFYKTKKGTIKVA
jgi:hypothetical protein